MRLPSFFSLALVPAVLGYALDAGSSSQSQVPLELGTKHIEFKSQKLHDTKLRYVNNSGVCETTPGVHQMSGYIDIGTNMSMWFWFFEARHNPDTAPFTLWLNGGPGCSSMLGLFQENGPCHVKSDNKTTALNPYSWNNLSNIIYIDQPIGSGFSYGTVDVNSTWAAAPPFWQAFQVLFESPEFTQYQSREFILATESYGGHYGPEFVTYFNEQNAKILQGTLDAIPVNVTALMINNGWYDPLIHNQAFLEFATNAPGYGQLQSDDVLAKMVKALYGEGGCKDQLTACYLAGQTPESNQICYDADDFCRTYVEALAAGDRYEYDLRQQANSTNIYPPSSDVNFLSDPEVLKQIGAEVPYSQCSSAVDWQFNRTGDDARTLLPELGALADLGMKILIWAGDADINCNWVGGYQAVVSMDWYGSEKLQQMPFTNMTINDEVVAEYKNLDNFSFARVYDAGHEVPAYKPEAAFEIFRQIVNMEPLHSVP